MKKFAVITRTKDRPVFLRRAIQSVANQTFDDFVHVIVNDGGNQNEVDGIVNSFSKRVHARIKVFHRETASGAPDTIFNESIGRVDSTYVAIHDDDDTWHPEFLGRTSKVLDKGAAGVLTRMDEVLETYKGNRIQTKKIRQYMPGMNDISLRRQCLVNQLTAGGFVYSRKAYESVGKYDDELPVAGDWEFGIRFLNKFEVKFLDPGFALAFYHKRTNVKEDSYAGRSHREIIDKVINKHLLEDKKYERPGLGQMLREVWDEHDSKHRLLKKFLPENVRKQLRKLRQFGRNT